MKKYMNSIIGWKSISDRIYEWSNQHFSRTLCEKIRDIDVDSLTVEERKTAELLKNHEFLDGDDITSRIMMFKSLAFGDEILSELLGLTKK